MMEQKKNESIKKIISVGLTVEKAESVENEIYNVLKEKGLTIEQADTLLDLMKDLIRMTVIIR